MGSGGGGFSSEREGCSVCFRLVFLLGNWIHSDEAVPNNIRVSGNLRRFLGVCSVLNLSFLLRPDPAA